MNTLLQFSTHRKYTIPTTAHHCEINGLTDMACIEQQPIADDSKARHRHNRIGLHFPYGYAMMVSTYRKERHDSGNNDGKVLDRKRNCRNPESVRRHYHQTLTAEKVGWVQSRKLMESERSRLAGVSSQAEEYSTEARSWQIKNKASSSSGWLGTTKNLIAVSFSPRAGKTKGKRPRDALPFSSITTEQIDVKLYKRRVCDGKHVPMSFFMTRFHRNILNQHLRHARELGLQATLTPEQWVSTVNDFNDKCAYCRENGYGVLEHFIPLSLGGGTTAWNCIPACQSCNILKSGVHPSMVPASKGMTEAIERVKQYLETRKIAR